MVIVAVFAGLALLNSGVEPKFEPIDLAQDVAPTRIDRIRPEEGDSAERLGFPPGAEAPKAGKIVLDISMCRFSVEPGPAGHPIRVEGRYDTSSFELEQDYSVDERGEWTYNLSFGRRGFGALFVKHEGSANHVRLIVPRDTPIVLEGTVGVGESEIELGGLWLLDVDLGLGVGEHELSFGEPLLAPLDRLRIDGSIGESRIVGVGNASPAAVEIDHSIGELLVDLRGEWVRDARVETRCGIGSCRLRMPRGSSGIGVVLEDAGVMIGESNLTVIQRWPAPEPGSPTLTLSMTNKLGELHVER